MTTAETASPGTAPHRPRVVAGITVHPLFPKPLPEGTWLLGCKATERYLALPGSALLPVRRAVGLMDGTCTPSEIKSRILNRYGQLLDVELLCARLDAAGLLQTESNAATITRTNVDKSALHLFTANVDSFFRAINRRTPDLPSLWFLTLAIVFAAAMVVVVAIPGGMEATASVHWAAILIIGVISVALHELSHGLAALRDGLLPRSLTGALYLGFIPILYLRLPGIYLLPRGGRIRVWIAGCAANAAIGGLALALQRVMGPETSAAALCAWTAQWNFALIALNLCPLLPTDGYFLISTLLNECNLRGRAWRALTSWLELRWIGVTWAVAAYLSASLGVVLLVVWGSGHWQMSVVLLSSTVVWGYVLRRFVSPAWFRGHAVVAKRIKLLVLSVQALGGFGRLVRSRIVRGSG